MNHMPRHLPRYSEKPRRRFEEHYETGKPMRLSPYHRSVLAKRSLFLARVVASDQPERLLKSGVHQRKIGSHVAKGAWRGMPIFTLTLEERATCPETCRNWLTCYGNAMNWSERITADAGLMPRLADELDSLAREFRRGFVVRLHILGDFFSEDYVGFWAEQMARHDGLRVFGYTAWQPGTAIGDAVAAVRELCRGRFQVRHSDAPPSTFGTRTIKTAEEAGDAIICPAQTGKSACCSSCALCWSTSKRIAFLEH
jgi:hypothetical protein